MELAAFIILKQSNFMRASGKLEKGMALGLNYLRLGNDTKGLGKEVRFITPCFLSG